MWSPEWPSSWYPGPPWRSGLFGTVTNRHQRTVGRQQREVLLDTIDGQRLHEREQRAMIVLPAADGIVDEVERRGGEHVREERRRHAELAQHLRETQVQ